MASFYKRGDYQWEAKIRKAGFPQLARTFESKADAMAWAAEVETEMRRGNLRAIDIARYPDERLEVNGVCPATVVREMGLLQRGVLRSSYFADLSPGSIWTPRLLKL